MVDKINKQAFKLVQLLEKKKQIVRKTKPQKEFIGINKSFRIHEAPENWQESSTDEYGERTSKFTYVGNELIGLSKNSYKEYKKFINEILEIHPFSTLTEYNFLEKKVFEWLIETYKNKQAKTELYNYLLDETEINYKEYLFYFKILSLGIEEPFNIGKVQITFLKLEEFEKHYEKYKDEIANEKEKYLKYFHEFTSLPLACIKIEGLKHKARETAKQEINLSIDALKIFFINESLSYSHQIFDVDYRFNSLDSSTHLVRSMSNKADFTTHYRRTQGILPIEISKESLNNLNKIGLQKISDFLLTRKKNEFTTEIIEGIHLLSNATSTRDLTERVVKLISFLEKFTIPKQANRGKGLTILKKNVLPIILKSSDLEKGISLVKSFYDIRNKYLHNHVKLKIDLHELYYFQKVTLIFLLYLIEKKDQFTTHNDLINHLDVKVK